MCKCSVCKKQFTYGDEQSPMLKDEIWKRVLEYYNLTEIEEEKEEAFYAVYNLRYFTKSERFINIIDNIACMDGFHVFICYECMEKALSRKLTREDLIGENVPINIAFEEKYFKQ